MNDLIYRLLLFLNSCKEKNINYTIATTILHNVRKIPNMNINQIADMCYTSPAAISRFCRKLGYENLAEFKRKSSGKILIQELNDLIPNKESREIARESILNKMHKEIQEEINNTINTIDLKLVDRVLDLIYSKEKIYLFGTRFSQLMVQDLQFRFAALGKLMIVANDVQEQEELSKELDERALVILISPSGKFYKYHDNIWNNVKNSLSSLVVLTANKDSIYKEFAEYILYFSNIEKEYSFIESQRYSLTYIIEYMQIRYSSLYYKEN